MLTKKSKDKAQSQSSNNSEDSETNEPIQNNIESSTDEEELDELQLNEPKASQLRGDERNKVIFNINKINILKKYFKYL